MNTVGAVVIEGHVQGLSNVRSLGELGIPVYVVDCTRCIAQYSKYCKKSFLCPPFQSDDFVPFLLDLARKEGLNGWLIMASNDHIVEQLSKHKKELQFYYRFTVPDHDTLLKILDKWDLLKIAQLAGTHVPLSCNKECIGQARQFKYPVLVKGCKGLSFYKTYHRKVIRADDYSSLLKLTKELDSEQNFFVQEEIMNSRNEVVSLTCFAEDGVIKTYWMGVKIREHPIQYGTATLAQSVLYEGVLEEAAPLIKALGYTGVCEIEFMYDERDGLYKLIEINPRTWLWVGLAKACGVDYAKMVFNYVNCQPQSFPDDYVVGLKWINRLTDFPYSVMAIIKRKIGLKSYLKSLKGKKVYAVWDRCDRLPGLLLPFLSFYILRHRR